MKKQLVTNAAALVLFTFATLGSGYARAIPLPVTTNSSRATMHSPFRARIGRRRTHRSNGRRGHDPI